MPGHLPGVTPADRFTALYDATHARVYAYLAARAGRQVAEELAGEVFAVAWRRFADLPDPPLPWLLGVARNLLREEYRAAARRAVPPPEWAAGVAAADPADLVTERDAVLAALARLGTDDRDLLTLAAWHDLTPREAAAVLGCSPATYYVRLHRARRRLERALETTEPRKDRTR